MIKRTVNVTCFLPDGLLCNVASRELCRFCVKHPAGYTCVLYNEPLLATGPKMIRKCSECIRQEVLA